MQIRVKYSVTYECVLDNSNTEPNEIEESIKQMKNSWDFDTWERNPYYQGEPGPHPEDF